MNLRVSLQAFQHAALRRRVAVRYASDFGKLPKGDQSFYRDSVKALKSLGVINRLKKKLDRLDGAEAAQALDQVIAAGSEMHDLGIQIHKKLSGMESKLAKDEFNFLKTSLRDLEQVLNESKGSTMQGFTAKQISDAAEKLYGDLNRIGALSLAGSLRA